MKIHPTEIQGAQTGTMGEITTQEDVLEVEITTLGVEIITPVVNQVAQILTKGVVGGTMVGITTLGVDLGVQTLTKEVEITTPVVDQVARTLTRVVEITIQVN